MKSAITMVIYNKDDIDFVTEFPCLSGHPVVYNKATLIIIKKNYFTSLGELSSSTIDGGTTTSRWPVTEIIGSVLTCILYYLVKMTCHRDPWICVDLHIILFCQDDRSQRSLDLCWPAYCVILDKINGHKDAFYFI